MDAPAAGGAEVSATLTVSLRSPAVLRRFRQRALAFPGAMMAGGADHKLADLPAEAIEAPCSCLDNRTGHVKCAEKLSTHTRLRLSNHTPVGKAGDVAGLRSLENVPKQG